MFIRSFIYYRNNISGLLFYDLVVNTYMFVCVEVLRPSQLNGVMSSAVRVLSQTFTGQA